MAILELPKNLLPQPPGVPVRRVGNPRSNSGTDLLPSRRAARVFRREDAHSSARSYHVSADQPGAYGKDSALARMHLQAEAAQLVLDRGAQFGQPFLASPKSTKSST